VWVGSKGPILFFIMDYLLFKLELELMGLDTFGKDKQIRLLF